MGITVRKIRLYPEGDKNEVKRVYDYIRNGQEVQALMMNKCITALYTARMNGASKEEMAETRRLHSRVPSSSKGSAYDFDMDMFPTGLPLAGGIPRVCEQKLQKAYKDGLAYGCVSLPTFKKTMPIPVPKYTIAPIGSITLSNGKTSPTGLYHDYDSPGELSEALQNERNPKIHIRFVNKIEFGLNLGNPWKSAELRTTLERIFGGLYEVCDSSIGIKDNRIMLNLVIMMPDKEKAKAELNKNTVVGVAMGLNTPCVCCLNNDAYARELIGSYSEFTGHRVKMQKERSKLHAGMVMTKGGHGRKKKLHHMDVISANERNFARTYNHAVSKEVVKFALNKGAKYINLQYLKGLSKDQKGTFLLRNWSYYELQTMIKYKAAAEGIEVRFVKGADEGYEEDTQKKKTSKRKKQIEEMLNTLDLADERGEEIKDIFGYYCSVCGKRGDHVKSSFICSDTKCKSHTMYKGCKNGLGYDVNRARNIAQSENFVSEKKKANKTNPGTDPEE